MKDGDKWLQNWLSMPWGATACKIPGGRTDCEEMRTWDGSGVEEFLKWVYTETGKEVKTQEETWSYRGWWRKQKTQRGRVEELQSRQETQVLLAGKKSRGVQATRDGKDKSTSEGEVTWFYHELKQAIMFGEILDKNQSEIRRESQNIPSQKGPI